jgi:hypothetical protein
VENCPENNPDLSGGHDTCSSDRKISFGFRRYFQVYNEFFPELVCIGCFFAFGVITGNDPSRFIHNLERKI